MSSYYGENLKLSIFGQSHGVGIGMVLDGIPAGLPADTNVLQEFLNRRAPGQNDYSTPRREEDRPEFLSGLLNGYTCGSPIAAMIRNTNTRSGDYAELRDCPRPGHADYTAERKYRGFQDPAGGGHFSGRLTAPICIAGGLCLQWLAAKGIRIGAHIVAIADVKDSTFNPCAPEMDSVRKPFPVLNANAEAGMREAIRLAREDGDSVGGIIECAVIGLPVGLGEPMFGGVEGRMSAFLFGIPAVKGVEFGDGFAAAGLRGSENNDAFRIRDGLVHTESNHCGGILGGITNAEPLIFRTAIKPTPSISQMQESVSLSHLENRFLEIRGRHDPCIVPRAVPVVEAAAAIVVMDLLLDGQNAFHV